MKDAKPVGARIYLLAGLPPLFWAGNFVVARLMRDEIPPIQMSLWRWVAAAVLLLPFAAGDMRRDWPRIRGNLPFLVLLAVVGVTAFNSLIYVALHHTTVLNGALINSLMPVVTFVLAFFLLRERLSPRQLTGIVISLVGAVVVITQGRPLAALTLSLNRGDLLVLVGLSCWALYTTLVKWRPPRLQPLALLGVTFWLGALFHLPLVAWEISQQGGFQPSTSSLSAILYLAVFPSILAYVIWNRCIVLLGPGRTGMFMHLMPIFSGALAVSFLGERLGMYHLVAFSLVVFGIWLVTHPAAQLKPH